MRKTILLGIAIASAFVIGTLTANPVVEAVGGWKEAIQGLQDQIDSFPIPESQIYEVSGVSVIPIGSIEGSVIQLRCLEGDTFYEGLRKVRMSTTVDVTPRALSLINYQSVFNPSPPNFFDGHTGIIGADVRARMAGGSLTFEVPVTATGLCFSPSP